MKKEILALAMAAALAMGASGAMAETVILTTDTCSANCTHIYIYVCADRPDHCAERIAQHYPQWRVDHEQRRISVFYPKRCGGEPDACRR